MAQVTFYLLDENNAESNAQQQHACQLASECYRNKQRCLLYFDNQTDAEAFDEMLWQLPTDSFVPHNLVGEGPKAGAPVELSWQTPQQFGRPVLINMSSEMPSFSQRFQRIYDFVPVEAQAKQQARERYKHYRAAGHQLDTAAAKL